MAPGPYKLATQTGAGSRANSSYKQRNLNASADDLIGISSPPVVFEYYEIVASSGGSLSSSRT